MSSRVLSFCEASCSFWSMLLQKEEKKEALVSWKTLIRKRTRFKFSSAGDPVA